MLSGIVLFLNTTLLQSLGSSDLLHIERNAVPEEGPLLETRLPPALASIVPGCVRRRAGQALATVQSHGDLHGAGGIALNERECC